tara:strand:- start:20003 stop:21670 length:1668 start_codon:yes stop_codon:yes gene_type:complete
MSSFEKISISSCGTHHVGCDGKPVYSNRFHEVLAYHKAGEQSLAPVSIDGRAWHIGADGQPIYSASFDRTFGFYCGYAAVILAGEWFHIQPDGSPLYSERYSFTGNYQEDIAVVCDSDGCYYHIDNRGKPLYRTRWRYCGDFRGGIAVVQSDTGLSTHIYRDGSFVHGKWFVDLDVFHKSYARAKDANGWHHINLGGSSIYVGGYASVEPFYNGLSRCETFGGGLVIIDERGQLVRQIRPDTVDHFADLSADMVGYWRTFTISVAVELGVFDGLPSSLSDLSVSKCLAEDRLTRLLNALMEMGLVDYSSGQWVTTEKGAFLCSRHPKTLVDAAAEYSSDLLDRWKALPDLIRGSDVDGDIFKVVADDSCRMQSHHRMLRSYAIHDYPALLSEMDIKSGDVVFDAGGGTGALASMVQKLYPKSEVILGDIPQVVSSVRFPRVVGFNFFEPWPMSADKILLSRVLHDWPNEKVRGILLQAAAALRPGGRIYIIEMLLKEGSASGSLCDLHLMAVTGGQERTKEQFNQLARLSGLELESECPSVGLVSMLCFKRPDDR